MSRMIGVRFARAALAVSALVAASASPARGQAWLPPQGEGAVSFMFQDMFFRYHALPTARVDVGQIWTKSMLVDVTYGVTDRLAISFGVPWVAGRYQGPRPHPLSLTDPTANPIDDGTYHSTFQDVRFDVRYNIAQRGAVLTPFAASMVPSHDYPFFAHAAPGRRLKELQVGVSGAKLLDDIVPGLFVQGRYAYGISQKIADISHNRSMVNLEVGYFLTPKLRLLALSAGQLTHGGVDVSTNGRAELGPLFAVHDQIDRVNFLTVGGGASYTLTDTIDLFGSMMRTVAQRNGHVLNRGLSLGVSWGFTTKRARDRALEVAERGLSKCLCEKGAP
jgi:hypothetical protein